MIENTSQRDAFIHLIGMTDGLQRDDSQNYILGMEADGQRQLVASSELPKNGPWDELEALGFVRGEDVPGDDPFVNATLPEGWKKEPTDHSMWSKVVDERGIERVAVFYKAAFYDRRAFCRISPVGDGLASDARHGEGPVALPASWEVLTDTEKADYAKALIEARDRDIENKRWQAPEFHAETDEDIRRMEAFLELVPVQYRGGAE